MSCRLHWLGWNASVDLRCEKRCPDPTSHPPAHPLAQRACDLSAKLGHSLSLSRAPIPSRLVAEALRHLQSLHMQLALQTSDIFRHPKVCRHLQTSSALALLSLRFRLQTSSDFRHPKVCRQLQTSSELVQLAFQTPDVFRLQTS